MKILVADDSKTTRALITESLKRLGHEVIPASSGHEAVELFQSSRPDLIILDVIMEEMDGFECARRIRALDANNWVPIIFLSGAVDDENIAKGINAGGDDYLTKPFSEITLSAKIKAMQRISDMQHQLFEATQKLSALSSTDALTGVYNRLQFDRTIKEKIYYSNRYNKLLALLFIDLDNFKMINDSLGHYVGDLLLNEFAKRLKSCLRLDDFIARIGGDEFAIILSEIDSPEMAGEVAKKIINVLSMSYHLAGHDLQMSSSIGIACYPSPDTDQENWVQNADIAMYHAKELGRNNFQYFTVDLNEQHKQQVNLEQSLKSALDKQELFLAYQPILNLKAKKMVRMEVLCCWKHPEQGIISPNIFIPLAEELGLIDVIGRWVLQSACNQAKEWFDAGYKNFKMSVNLSPRQLLQKDLPRLIDEMLGRAHIPARLLELELTETSALIYSHFSEDVLNKIHDIGVGIALDDFGTGYSSLTHLKRLPISTIKIDKLFIQDIIVDSNSAMIVKSVIALGNNLGFDVIAEGIETAEQLQFLIDNNCALGQGFYLYQPLSQIQMTDLLKECKEGKSMLAK